MQRVRRSPGRRPAPIARVITWPRRTSEKIGPPCRSGRRDLLRSAAHGSLARWTVIAGPCSRHHHASRRPSSLRALCTDEERGGNGHTFSRFDHAKAIPPSLAVSKRVNDRSQATGTAKRVTDEPGIGAPSSLHLVWRFGRLAHTGQFAWQKLLRMDAEAMEAELALFQQEPIALPQRKRWLRFIPSTDITPDGQGAGVAPVSRPVCLQRTRSDSS